MDLIDFTGQEETELYFHEQLPESVRTLIDRAAEVYGEGGGELELLQAFFQAPESLEVLVALYRFYYYRHSYPEALTTARHALRISGARLGFPADWRALTPGHVNRETPMGLLRFYLMVLKGMAYLTLRGEALEEGEAMIDKVMLLDPADRLNGSVLKQVVRERKGALRVVK